MQIRAINYNNFVNFRAKQPKSLADNYAHLAKMYDTKTNETSTLAEKYNIDVDKLPVIKSKDIEISQEEKAILVEKLLEAHELAKKNFNYGNIARAGFATNIGLKNGMWHLATNFNNTRNDLSSICGERTAILGAYNDLLKSKDIENPDKNPLDFDIKYMAMSSYKPIGTDRNAASSCAECLSWFNTNRYFSDDTIIAVFDKKNDKLVLKLTPLIDYLPLRNEVNTVIEQDVTQLPIKLSKSALKTIRQKGLTRSKVIGLISKTQEKYNQNNQTETSGQNIASGILANGKTFIGTKTDFTKRWYIDPLQIATSKAVEEFGNDTKIDAICYLGESTFTDKYGLNYNDGVVNLKTIGALRERFADDNTLMITTTKDNIEVRTINDFMPDKFRYHPQYK